MICTLSIGDIIDRANRFPAVGLLEDIVWKTDMNWPLSPPARTFNELEVNQPSERMNGPTRSKRFQLACGASERRFWHVRPASLAESRATDTPCLSQLHSRIQIANSNSCLSRGLLYWIHNIDDESVSILIYVH
jgi:hypothetical protein